MKKYTPHQASVQRAQENIVLSLQPAVQDKFRFVLEQLKQHLRGSTLWLDAPPSERWLTVKARPRKAVLAFREDRDGNLVLDIDTYPDNDITDPRRLLTLIPNRAKPNKRHVRIITPNTSNPDVDYFVRKMIEGIQTFEN